MAERNVKYVQEILKVTGLSPDRVQMFHCSAAEGQVFQNKVTKISEMIEKLGSNPIKESSNTKKETEDSKDKKRR